LAKLENFTGDIAGRTLILHIDRAVQYMMEDELKKGMELYGAQSVTAAVMDPKTGGIIAMASLPSFDPRSYQDYSDDLFLNPFISDTYDP